MSINNLDAFHTLQFTRRGVFEGPGLVGLERNLGFGWKHFGFQPYAFWAEAFAACEFHKPNLNVLGFRPVAALSMKVPDGAVSAPAVNQYHPLIVF